MYTSSADPRRPGQPLRDECDDAHRRDARRPQPRDGKSTPSKPGRRVGHTSAGSSMLDIQFIRQNADRSAPPSRTRGSTSTSTRSSPPTRSGARRRRELEQQRARKNELSAAHPEGDARTSGPALVDEAKQVRTDIEQLEPQLAEVAEAVPRPDAPRAEHPAARGARSARARRTTSRSAGSATPRKFDFTPKDHVELMTSLGLVDWDGPRRFAGARSYALVGDGALLELAVLAPRGRHARSSAG